MPESHTQKLINIMQAYLKGEIIECKCRATDGGVVNEGIWKEVKNPIWDFDACEYRVKEPFNIWKSRAYSIAASIELHRSMGVYSVEQVSQMIAQYALDCINDPKLEDEVRTIVEMK